MAKEFPLATVMEVVQRQVDEAERRLHELKDRVGVEEEKLRQLQHFRQEYQNRLQVSVQGGMHIAQWRDYQAFMGKLDAAIRQQDEEIGRAKARWEAGKREWLSERSRLKAYDTLAQRHFETEQKKEARREQREQDEHALKVSRPPKDGG